MSEGYDVTTLCLSSAKIKNTYTSMIRKGFVSDSNTLNLRGKALLNFMNSPQGTVLPVKKSADGLFVQWWKSYPGTDTFTLRNKVFKGSRSLRSGKPKAKIYWDKIIESGEYTGEQIIEATLYDVNLRKENSFKSGRNNLTFMQNAATYLYNDSYEGFVELIATGIDVNKSTKANDVDI